MSLMCKMSDKCCATKGPCVHEWMMMMAVAVMGMLAAAGHWVFEWF